MAISDRFLLFILPLKVPIFNFTWLEIFRVYVSASFYFFDGVQGKKSMQDILPIWIYATKPGLWVQCECRPKPEGM